MTEDNERMPEEIWASREGGAMRWREISFTGSDILYLRADKAPTTAPQPEGM